MTFILVDVIIMNEWNGSDRDYAIIVLIDLISKNPSLLSIDDEDTLTPSTMDVVLNDESIHRITSS